MKTNTILITLWVIVSILLIWYVSVEARNNWFYQKYFWWNKQNHQVQNSQNMNHSGSIENIEKSELSEQEKELVLFQYTEEKVAHDLYTYFYSLYNIQTFKNIAESEAKHMEQVQLLIDRYGLSTPTEYGVLAQTYDELKAKWEKSLNDALEVGIQVEMLDIEDITKTIKTVDNDDIKFVFLNIGGASYNHLRWFAKNAHTKIDYSKYLSSEEVQSAWWALKGKLLERLESEWMTFSQSVKENIENCDWENNSQNMHQWKNWRGRWLHNQNF